MEYQFLTYAYFSVMTDTETTQAPHQFKTTIWNM